MKNALLELLALMQRRNFVFIQLKVQNQMGNSSEKILLKEFNASIQLWIDYLDDYSLEILCAKSDVDSWSLGQIYLHIADDTRWFVQQMRASSEAIAMAKRKWMKMRRLCSGTMNFRLE